MKKKLGFFTRFLYWINIIGAILLIVSFALPFIPPKKFPLLSLLSLTVSPLIILNSLFVLYWLFKLRFKALLSMVVITAAYLFFGSFFKFSSEINDDEFSNTLTVFSYNVRLFNAYEKKVFQAEVPNILASLMKEQQPDVICIQEYYYNNKADFSNYPYRYVYFKEKHKLGHAIFSKFPLVNKKSFNFKNTYNNAICADVIKGADTLRVYNLHLQSLGIIPRVSYLQNVEAEKFINRVSNGFVKQQEQMEIIIAHKKSSSYPVIICGDFNNSAFSYVYREISRNMKDAFEELGNGIGTTYLFGYYPMRIDYILASKELEVVNFETSKKTFSDHYAITATLGWH